MREKETEEGGRGGVKKEAKKWEKEKKNWGEKRGFASALVTVTIRATAVHSSTIMSNINPYLRKFDSNFVAVQGEPSPVLFQQEKVHH